ncbi:MAG: SWIM zinc finger family protein [Synergistaceae bacterium]|nr:SWIM zinc finger family protein [Synergistaceae bacterium]
MMKILLKLFKYACGCAMAFFALILIAGSTNDAKQNPALLIIPLLMLLAGFLTYRAAKRKSLEGSGFTWWLYGTFVPVVSWIDVHNQPARNVTAQSPLMSHGRMWDLWDMEHDKPEQRKRWQSAEKDCELVKMLDESQGVALIRGNRGGEYTTSLAICSCPDFAKRRKPCKHMYYLAHYLGVFDPYSNI